MFVSNLKRKSPKLSPWSPTGPNVDKQKISLKKVSRNKTPIVERSYVANLISEREPSKSNLRNKQTIKFVASNRKVMDTSYFSDAIENKRQAAFQRMQYYLKKLPDDSQVKFEEKYNLDEPSTLFNRKVK